MYQLGGQERVVAEGELYQFTEVVLVVEEKEVYQVEEQEPMNKM